MINSACLGHNVTDVFHVFSKNISHLQNAHVVLNKPRTKAFCSVNYHMIRDAVLNIKAHKAHMEMHLSTQTHPFECVLYAIVSI